MATNPNQGSMFADYNFDGQYADLARRQKLLDAYQMKAVAPLEAPEPGRSGRFEVAAPISPFQVLTKLGEVYAVKKGQEEFAKERDRVNAEITKGFGEEIKAYSEASKDDPRGALLNLMMSRNPMAASYAKTVLEAKAKESGKLHSFKPGEIIANSDAEVVKLKMPEGSPGVQTIQSNGDTMQLSPSGTGMSMLDRGTNVKVNVSPIIKGEGKLFETLGEEEGKSISQIRANKRAAQGTLVMADRMETLINQGVLHGPAANISMLASSLNDALGVPGVREDLARSEEFKSLLGKEAATMLLGPQGGKLTDKDLEVIMSKNPTLTNSERGKRAIIDSLRKAANRDIAYANKVEERIRKVKPDAVSLLDVDPSNEPYPPTTEVSQPTRKRVYDPKTRTFK